MIKNKLVIIIFLGLTTINILFLLTSYKVTSKKLEKQIEINLENQSRFFLDSLKLEEYQKFIENSSSKDSDKEYLRLVKPLKDKYQLTKDRNKFAYTILFKEKKVMFGLDVTPKGDEDKDGVEDHSFYMNEYFDAPLELKEFNGNPMPILTKVYSDRWGSFISYYKPIINENQFLGYLGLDMNADLYMKDINQVKYYCIIGFFIIMTLTLGLCYLIARVISRNEKSHQIEIELKEKKQELEVAQLSKLAALGEFSSILTHEINNPLQSIWSQVEMIDLYLNTPNNESKISDTTKKIMSSLQKIQDIIKSTKKFIRNDDEEVLESTDFLTLLNESKVLFLDKLKKYEIEFKTNLSDGVLIDCHPSQIQQVLLNTINNSIFSIKDLDKKWIEIRHSQSLDHHIFSIIDSGPELSLEIQQKIKNKFFSTKKNGEGSGLGLSICNKIIKNHSGEFYYNPNLGTVCFEFKLPKAKKNVIQKVA